MKPATKRLIVLLTICVVFTVVFSALFCFRDREAIRPLQNAEYSWQNWLMRYGRKNVADSQLVLIGIDRLTYANAAFFQPEELQAEPALHMMEEMFPWSRAVSARLIERLVKSGAKVVAVDLIFAAPGQDDDELKRVLDQYRDHVVIAYDTIETKTARGELTSIELPNQSIITYPEQIHPVEDDRLGFISLWPDSDGVVRQGYYRQTGESMRNVLPPDIMMESLAARVLRKYGRPDLIPEGTDPRQIRYTATPGFGYVPLPIGTVISPRLWKTTYGDGEFFKNKIVLIGPTAELFHDFHTVPLNSSRPRNLQEIAPNQMAGPEIHMNIIAAALHREFLNEPEIGVELLVICLLGLISFALCIVAQNPLKRLLGLGCANAGYIGLVFAFFNRSIGLLLPIATPLLVLNLSGITTSAYDYFLERREKRRVRRTLERYVSKDLVKEVLDNPESFLNSLGGVRKSVTVLFSDIRGFTTLTESGDSAALVKQLNEYFQEMVGAVFSHRGTLDKFIGDAVMAVWGNIDISDQNQKDGALRAVATALAMKRSLLKLNEDWKTRGMLQLAFGIGINHGEVIVGNLGCQEKMDPTVIGDAVNLASRLEGLTKEYHLDLLLGEQMAQFVGGTYILRTVDYVQVKGKTKPVDVFTVMGDGAAQTVSMPVWLARYEDGVKLYRERKFSEAAAEFQECLRKQPDDYLSSMYLKRCQALIENPPDESWNGVFVMTKK